jgi:hypothetical protein
MWWISGIFGWTARSKAATVGEVAALRYRQQRVHGRRGGFRLALPQQLLGKPPSGIFHNRAD